MAHIGEKLTLRCIGLLSLLSHNAQFLSLLHLVRDVPVRTDHTDRFSVCIPIDLTLAKYVAHRAIGVLDAKLDFEITITVQCLLKSTHSTIVVIGMNAVLPSLNCLRKIIGRNSIELKHLIVPLKDVFNDIPIIDSDASDRCGEPKPFIYVLKLLGAAAILP